jgi:hypothetical protein
MTTSERTVPPQAILVLDNNCTYFLHHYIAKKETGAVLNVAFPRE